MRRLQNPWVCNASLHTVCAALSTLEVGVKGGNSLRGVQPVQVQLGGGPAPGAIVVVQNALGSCLVCLECLLSVMSHEVTVKAAFAIVNAGGCRVATTKMNQDRTSNAILASPLSPCFLSDATCGC